MVSPRTLISRILDLHPARLIAVRYQMRPEVWSVVQAAAETEDVLVKRTDGSRTLFCGVVEVVPEQDVDVRVCTVPNPFDPTVDQDWFEGSVLHAGIDDEDDREPPRPIADEEKRRKIARIGYEKELTLYGGDHDKAIAAVARLMILLDAPR